MNTKEMTEAAFAIMGQKSPFSGGRGKANYFDEAASPAEKGMRKSVHSHYTDMISNHIREIKDTLASKVSDRERESMSMELKALNDLLSHVKKFR